MLLTQTLFENQANSTDSFMFLGKVHRIFNEIGRVHKAVRNQTPIALCATRLLVLLERSLIFLLFLLEYCIEDQGSHQKNDQVQSGK